MGIVSQIRSGLRDHGLFARMVTALESLAESQRTLAELAVAAAEPAPLRDIAPVTVGTLDIAATNAAYRTRVMEEQGLQTEEDYREFMDLRGHRVNDR
jgi:hypothetical protein